MKATQADKLSILSSKLKALVMPTTQKIVTKILNTSFAIKLVRIPSTVLSG